MSKDYFSVRNIDDSQVGAILINTPLDITESFKDQAKSFYFEFKLIEECPTPKIQQSNKIYQPNKQKFRFGLATLNYNYDFLQQEKR